jgi:hypothetical protein
MRCSKQRCAAARSFIHLAGSKVVVEAEFSPHEHGRATPPLLSFIAQGHLSTVASLAMRAPLPSQEPCGVHRMKAFGTCSARSR